MLPASQVCCMKNGVLFTILIILILDGYGLQPSYDGEFPYLLFQKTGMPAGYLEVRGTVPNYTRSTAALIICQSYRLTG